MMETKKHLQAEKKLKGALSTFTGAVADINQAIELKQESVRLDEARLVSIGDQIKALENTQEKVLLDIAIKREEIKKHIELSARLSEFSL